MTFDSARADFGISPSIEMERSVRPVSKVAPRKTGSDGSGRGYATRNAGLVRCIDVVLALAAGVFLLPLMAVIALLVFLQDGGPAIFRQERIGIGGRTFRCLKFRSMVADADARLTPHLAAHPDAAEEWALTHKLKSDPRITPLGRFLRKSSLDELPQIWNVLRGEMSLVGPRPIVDAEVVRYGRRYRSYCAVKPGITGLWQVSGRSDTSYRRRVAMDHLYARRRSLGLYVWIIVMTLPAVLMRRGSF